MHKVWHVAGIDLAWQGRRNTSAVSLGRLDGDVLVVQDVDPAMLGNAKLVETVRAHMSLAGVAIDAPLIITNVSGQRPCEKELSSEYGSRYAGCHPAYRYPASLIRDT